MLSHGTTITFDSGFCSEILSISYDGVERTPVPTSHFGTTGGATYTAPAFYEPGELVVELYHDFTDIPPLTGAAETVTITPVTGTDTISFSGFMTGYTMSFDQDQQVRGTARIKASGTPTWTTP